MTEVKIITDSTADLPIEIIKELDISIIPLYVTFNEEVFRDGIDMITTELYEKVESEGMLPKTAAPSPADFHNVFKPFIDEGRDILYIGLSSKLSSTIQNAKIAANEFPEGRIKIIDSFNLSAGIGLLVLKAASMAKEGIKLQDMAAKIQELVPKVKTAFVINTLEYLHKGGRCTSLQSFVGGMLKIRPIVQVVDGKMILGHKTRGKIEKSLNALIELIKTDEDPVDTDYIIIAQSEGLEEATYVKAELETLFPDATLIFTTAGCVISSHCGPKTVGIMYLNKNNP
ncbi:DegV family protein [Alkaliphilus serpentinus]|uniref:DegV family protein n=1 Tax=Alkaliphilus serpentinus TaxID=1482731 RepID=A0A833HN23_9FIRM|nr:DegV family protein [Alkaliphilus serpentinus]KAB3529159.1 DegV family protein [Alkaliphilus serpentinus]